MPHDLIQLPLAGTTALSTELAAELNAADDFAAASLAASTRTAYAEDWRAFATWCHQRGLQPMPAQPEAICGHIAAMAQRGMKPASIARRVAALRWAHRQAGYEPPSASEQVKATLSGIRRCIGTAPAQKTAATAPMIAAMLQHCDPDTLRGARDRAMLLLGFACALRRSELVALQVADLVPVADGLRITIRRSKTDQDGQGAEIAVPRGSKLRPVEAVEQWLAMSGITEGPLFRRILGSNRLTTEPLLPPAAAEIVKRLASLSGFDPALFAGHSLRSGYVTSAVEANANIMKVCEVTRHRSVEMIRTYSRRANLFHDHSGAAFL